MSIVAKFFAKCPWITAPRVIVVGLIVWTFSVLAGLYTDFAPLPPWASHLSPWAVLFVRKWPYTIPLLWLAVTGFFTWWQSKKISLVDPPMEKYRILCQLSDEQAREYEYREGALRPGAKNEGLLA